METLRQQLVHLPVGAPGDVLARAEDPARLSDVPEFRAPSWASASVFPEPLGPTRAVTFPSCASKLMPWMNLLVAVPEPDVLER